MLRRLPFVRRSPITSLSSRQVRYVLFAAFLFLLIVFLPQRLAGEPATDQGFSKPDLEKKKSSPFSIQFAFGEEKSAAKKIRLERKQKVREAFLHAWKGYKDHAWLHDELLPISGGKKDPYVGWAATLVDGLDSLLILGLQDEFDHALKALDSINFSKPNSERVPVFETTIRYLGGLLGAYDVSGGKYPKLLTKADQLGEFLFRAFNTSNGIPVPYYVSFYVSFTIFRNYLFHSCAIILIFHSCLTRLLLFSSQDFLSMQTNTKIQWWNGTDELLVGESGVLVAQIGKEKEFKLENPRANNNRIPFT